MADLNSKINIVRKSKINSGLAGEFAVMSELAARGFLVAQMPGNNKDFDLIAVDSNRETHFLQIKTSANLNDRESRIFAGRHFEWKVKPIQDDKLIYCFVLLAVNTTEYRNRFFVVPNNIVSKYTINQHKYWREQRGELHDPDYPIKTFRIGVNRSGNFAIKTPLDIDYENKWDIIS